MDAPDWVGRDEFEALRPGRALPPGVAGLWSSGSLEGLRGPTAAIVGTRAATGYGKALAREFAAGLVRAGCCILSGLALGIDALAHEGALEAGGRTIGVLGGGHACFFPRRNRPLAGRMLAGGGAVLSPYPPAQPARPGQFLERNGVVAALADAVVVIEAPARSGALNTAGWAAGRVPVFAVPGDVDRPHFAGCHALIRDGAILARSPQDVIDDLRLGAAAPPEMRANEPPADPLAASLIAAIAQGERTLDELVALEDAPPARVLAALSLLEIEGFTSLF